jgi:hypothetical protein
VWGFIQILRQRSAQEFVEQEAGMDTGAVMKKVTVSVDVTALVRNNILNGY